MKLYNKENLDFDSYFIGILWWNREKTTENGVSFAQDTQDTDIDKIQGGEGFVDCFGKIDEERHIRL